MPDGGKPAKRGSVHESPVGCAERAKPQDIIIRPRAAPRVLRAWQLAAPIK